MEYVVIQNVYYGGNVEVKSFDDEDEAIRYADYLNGLCFDPYSFFEVRSVPPPFLDLGQISF